MDTFSALAVPTRRKIIELLASQGVLTASEIYHHFTVSAPTISQHLKVLQATQLVIVERIAQRRLYRINNLKLAELEQWTRTITAEWDKKYTSLDAVLKTQSQPKK